MVQESSIYTYVCILQCTPGLCIIQAHFFLTIPLYSVILERTLYTALEITPTDILHVVEAKGKILVLVLERLCRKCFITTVQESKLDEHICEISGYPCGLQDGNPECELLPIC